MKTFNYESNCVKYRDCFFDIGEYEKGKMSLSIYGHIENDENISHISNVTVNVEEKLEKMNPIILDYLPLTLEEVFIYQMEALGYEFESVI